MTGRGPPSCQAPSGCDADAVAGTRWTYCDDHADLEPARWTEGYRNDRIQQ